MDQLAARHLDHSPDRPMGIREKLKEKPAVSVAVAILFVLAAGALLARTYWPEKKADLLQAYYSDDDGQTWFADSIFQVPPFSHAGRVAVLAQVYTYAGGSKKFCAYLTQFS